MLSCLVQKGEGGSFSLYSPLCEGRALVTSNLMSQPHLQNCTVQWTISEEAVSKTCTSVLPWELCRFCLAQAKVL
jgi:hypothetical protein